jgi:hypothetical protein
MKRAKRGGGKSQNVIKLCDLFVEKPLIVATGKTRRKKTVFCFHFLSALSFWLDVVFA